MAVLSAAESSQSWVPGLDLEALEGSVAELLFREQLQGCMARKELQFCACSQMVKDVRALLEIGFCSV